MTKKILITLLGISFLSSGLAQELPRFASLQEALMSGRKMSGGRGLQNINWINGGKAFSYIAKPGTISTLDATTLTEQQIFSSEGLKFPGTDKAFTYESFQWSADSKYLLFQTNFRPVWRYSGDADYYFYNMATKSLQLVAKDARTAELSPDGKKVGFERGGNLFVYDLATKKTTQLTFDAKEAVYNGRFGWAYEEEFGLVQAWVWSPDSRYLAFWKSDESKVPVYQMTDFLDFHPKFEKIPYPRVGDPNIQVQVGIIDLQQKNKRNWVNIPLNDGYIPRIYWTADPGQLALIHLNRKQNDLTLYFAQAGNPAPRKIMTETDSKGWIDVYDFFVNSADLMVFPKTVREFYWVSGRDGFQHIYRFDYQGNQLNQLTSGKYDVNSIAGLDEASKTIYYNSTEVSPLERHLFAIQTDGSQKRRITTEEGRHGINLASSGQYFIDTYSNTYTPTQVHLKSGDGKILKTFETNEAVKQFAKTHAFSPRVLTNFKTSDGQVLDIYIVKPLDFDPAKKYPLVLSIYGGPGSQSVYNQWSGSAWEQWLAQNGYVVASVNNRGSGGYGQAFMEKVYQNLGENEAKDFVETAKYLASLGWVDADRMAIQGHSYGGYMSAYTMLKHPGVFKVGLVGAPVTDFRLYDNIYTERYMGIMPESEKAYQNTVLANVAKNLEGKMLLAHSMKDDNVHISNTLQLVKAAIDAGKDIDLRIYPPGNHGVAYNAASSLLLQKTYFEYLEQHLKKKWEVRGERTEDRPLGTHGLHLRGE